jgi:redox-sensitive bicupin YhaK (pirin superfamily)
VTAPADPTPQVDGPRVELRRAADRFVTRTGWLTSWHCFSYHPHYDPANTHFGLLLACNDDTLAPGAGFDLHEHRESEAVTWVLAGALRHEDSAGNEAVLGPGTVQRMTAGRGVWHAERNASGAEPVRYVQMWLAPGEPGLPPSYQRADVSGLLAAGGLVPVASGAAGIPAPVRLPQPAAILHAARLHPGAAVTLPAAPFVHAYLAGGSTTALSAGDRPSLTGGQLELATGDSLRITGGPVHLTAGPAGAELLVWEMHRAL